MPIASTPFDNANPLDALMSDPCDTRANDLALVSLKTQLTWGQIAKMSSVLAAQYLALGLKPGDRIASLMPNRPALVIHYLACLKAGLVATPLNYRNRPAEIDHALEVSEASLLLFHSEREQDIAECQMASQLAEGLLRYKAPASSGRQFEELVSQALPNNDSLPVLDCTAPAFIYFTSGSTGKPKGVTHSRQTFNAMMAAVIAGMQIQDSDTFLPGASLSHIGGSLFGLSTLAAGGKLVITRGSEGEEIIPLLREYRPTVLWMLPAALITLIRDHDINAQDFSSLRLCVSGGDKVSLKLEQEFTGMAGIPVDESYGMTEIGLASINPPTGENRIGSVGKLCPGYQLSIRDDNGRELPVNAPGKLWIKSPTNTIGYWNNQKATAETISNGWLDTGDIMKVDADGYLWFCGRKKQIIIHDGSNICPQEVESALAEHPAVENVGVIGIHDLVHGENVRAYVTLNPNIATPTPSELIRFARERVGYKAPEEIVILQELPMNATGKVNRAILKEMAEVSHNEHAYP